MINKEETTVEAQATLKKTIESIELTISKQEKNIEQTKKKLSSQKREITALKRQLYLLTIVCRDCKHHEVHDAWSHCTKVPRPKRGVWRDKTTCEDLEPV